MNEWLAALIEARGPIGRPERITCDIVERSRLAAMDPGAIAGYTNTLRLLHEVGKPHGWRRITRESASTTLASVIGRELAYNYELLKPADARFFADAFLGFFEPDAECFTTAEDARTAANFDHGMTVLDRERVGIVWIESDNPGR